MSQAATKFQCSSTPTDLQRAVCKYVMTQAPVDHDASLTRYTINGAPSDKYWVLSGNLRFGHRSAQESFLTLSLPELSNKVFLGVSDQCRDTFEQLVSSFNAKSECNDALSAGYAELVKSPKLNRYGWGGVLIMEASRFLKNVPEVGKVNGESFEFLLLVPITVDEYMIWRNVGYKGLMQHFVRNKRSIFHFNQKLDDYNRLVPVKAEVSVQPQAVQSRSDQCEAVQARVTQSEVSEAKVSQSKTVKAQLSLEPAASPASSLRPQVAKLSAQTQVPKQTKAPKQQKVATRKKVPELGAAEFSGVQSQLSATKQSVKRQPLSLEPAATSAAISCGTSMRKAGPEKTKPEPSIVRHLGVLEVQNLAASEEELLSRSKTKRQLKKEAKKRAKARTDNTPTIAELNRIQKKSGGLKRAVGESAVGTVLLVGGFVTTMSYIGSDSPAMIVMPAVFTVAGLLTLASAFNDALSAGQQPYMQ